MKHLQTNRLIRRAAKSLGFLVCFLMLFSANKAEGQTPCGYTYTTSWDKAICQGDTAHYSVSTTSGGTKYYYWSIYGGNGSINNQGNGSALIEWYGTSYGYVKVVISDSTNGCIDSFTFSTAVIAPSASLSDTSICQGQSIGASVPAYPNYVYSWSSGHSTNKFGNYTPTSSEWVSVYAYDTTGSGCDIRDSFYVTVNTFSNTSITGNQLLCQDTAFYEATKYMNANYTWFVDGGKIMPDDTNSVSGAGLSGIYVQWDLTYPNKNILLVVTSPCGVDSISYLVNTVKYNIPPIADTTICWGHALAFAVPGKAGYSFIWKQGATTISTDTFLSINPTITTSYTLIVSDTSTGCSSSESFSVIVNTSNGIMWGSFITCPGAIGVYGINPIDTSAIYTWYLLSGSGVFQNGNDTFVGDNAHVTWDSTASDTATIMVVISGGSFCSDTFYKNISILPSPEASFTYTQQCGTGLVQFHSTSPGAVTYFWDFGDGSSMVIGQTSSPVHNYDTFGNYTVALTIRNQDSCEDRYSINIQFDTIPPTSVYQVDTVCKGDSIQLPSITGAWLYYWWDGNDSITTSYISPTTSFMYYANVIDSSGCSYIDSYYVHVDTNCVWPGDADASKLVDQDDALYIGIAYGETGASRVNASSNWYGQYAADWDSVFSTGANYKHADCDGDGDVDLDDLIPMGANFGYTHNKHNKQGQPGDPNLFIIFSKDSVTGGDAVKATIHLGSDTQTVSDVYGIAFVIDYNTNPFKSISSDLSNSWLGSNLMDFLHHDTTHRRIHMAISRTNQLNVSGSGEVGTLSIVLPDNIAGKREVLDTVVLTPSDVTLINVYENRFETFSIAAKVATYDSETGIRALTKSAKLQVYPNPVEHVLNITAEETIKEVRVYNLLGAEVMRISPQAKMATVSTAELSAGMYSIMVRTENGLESVKVIKK